MPLSFLISQPCFLKPSKSLWWPCSAAFMLIKIWCSEPSFHHLDTLSGMISKKFNLCFNFSSYALWVVFVGHICEWELVLQYFTRKNKAQINKMSDTDTFFWNVPFGLLSWWPLINALVVGRCTEVSILTQKLQSVVTITLKAVCPWFTGLADLKVCWGLLLLYLYNYRINSAFRHFKCCRGLLFSASDLWSHTAMFNRSAGRSVNLVMFIGHRTKAHLSSVSAVTDNFIVFNTLTKHSRKSLFA